MVKHLPILLLPLLAHGQFGAFNDQAFMTARAATTSASSLLTGLVAYWRFDEAATSNGQTWTNADGTANNWGTNHNAVTSATGIITNCVGITTTGRGIEVPKSIDSRAASTAWTLAFWFKDEGTTDSGEAMVSMQGAPENDWSINAGASNKPHFLTWDSSNVSTDLAGNTAIVCCGTTWTFIVCGFDGTNTFINVNNGTRATATPTDNRRGGSNLVWLNYGNFSFNWAGEIDEAGYWQRWLTTAEQTTLYNSGSGITYPFQ